MEEICLISLHKPLLEEMWFRQKLLSDEVTMSYNHAYGGTIDFSQERWKPWYNRWVNETADKRFYRYVTAGGEFVGEIAYHFDDDRKIYAADVIIHAQHRGNGYGRQALLLLCENAKQNGIVELYDDIAVDNPSVSLFLGCGFTEEYRTDEYVMLKKILTD